MPRRENLEHTRRRADSIRRLREELTPRNEGTQGTCGVCGGKVKLHTNDNDACRIMNVSPINAEAWFDFCRDVASGTVHLVERK